MKLKLLFYPFFIVLFLLLQTTLIGYAKIYGVIPNILVVFVIVTALVRGGIEGGLVGLFAGLATDMLTGRILGFHALLGLYLGVGVGFVNKRLFRENIIVAVVFTFIFSGLYETVVYIFSNIMKGSMSLLNPLTLVILPEAIYNSAIALLIYPLLIKADKCFTKAVKSVRKY